MHQMRSFQEIFLAAQSLDFIIPPLKKKKKRKSRDSPGGAVVKNPPSNAGDTGPGRSHMPQSS